MFPPETEPRERELDGFIPIHPRAYAVHWRFTGIAHHVSGPRSGCTIRLKARQRVCLGNGFVPNPPIYLPTPFLEGDATMLNKPPGLSIPQCLQAA